MEKRFRYNFELLYEATKRDNAILLQNYDKITKRSIIRPINISNRHLAEQSSAICRPIMLIGRRQTNILKCSFV
jgi:hypothetical protein